MPHSLYYHIQRRGRIAFRIGKTYKFGVELNLFTQAIRAQGADVEIRGVGTKSIDRVIDDFFDQNSLGYAKLAYSKDPQETMHMLLQRARDSLKFQNVLLRELIFEQVRIAKFPNRPSREKCIWLIPHQREILNYWAATAPKNRFKVYEVEASGNVHYGPSSLLVPHSLNFTDWAGRASDFWGYSGDIRSVQCEVLLTGEIRPLTEIPVEGSSQSGWKAFSKLITQRTQ